MATPPSDGTTPGSGTGPEIQYAYMFEDNKRPTKQLDALLRAIALFIVCFLPASQPPNTHTASLAAVRLCACCLE